MRLHRACKEDCQGFPRCRLPADDSFRSCPDFSISCSRTDTTSSARVAGCKSGMNNLRSRAIGFALHRNGGVGLAKGRKVRRMPPGPANGRQAPSPGGKIVWGLPTKNPWGAVWPQPEKACRPSKQKIPTRWGCVSRSAPVPPDHANGQQGQRRKVKFLQVFFRYYFCAFLGSTVWHATRNNHRLNKQIPKAIGTSRR